LTLPGLLAFFISRPRPLSFLFSRDQPTAAAQ
jgi:hypothetical protein